MARVAIRADASLQIGAGHIMRCLSLADGLQAAGTTVSFISGAHEGHLGEVISGRGFGLTLLPASCALGDHVDAVETAAILRTNPVDWLVVDHYGTDAAWDLAVRHGTRRVMVIDDLVDRRRDCDLLLNQNAADVEPYYQGYLPAHCRVLAGPSFALLRGEFLAASLRLSTRRRGAPVLNILVSLGGVDSANVTSRVLRVLGRATLPAELTVTVLLGPTAPWTAEVRSLAATLPLRVDLQVGPQSIAQLMFDADLAIGAAGSSSWERCAVGLPTVAVVIADNQRASARTLTKASAAVVLEAQDVETRLCPEVMALISDASSRVRMSAASSALVDGQGVWRVVSAMRECV